MRLAVGALVPIRAARSFRRSGPASAISISAIRWVAVIAGPSSVPAVMRVSTRSSFPSCSRITVVSAAALISR